jgi:hypothetical protein
MSDEEKTRRRLDQARELLREAQNQPMPADPDFLTKYAGEWVVLDHGQVVAHGKDGAEVAKAAPVSAYPYSVLYYVPTLEEQAGVRILDVRSLDG